MSAAADELARRIVDALEARDIAHAIGGSLALGAWGYARATVDVDLDVFVTGDGLEDVFDALASVGCEVDRAAARDSADERGDFRCSLEGMRVDVFVPSIPLYDSAKERIVRDVLLGRPAWFLSPEDLATFKMLFFRTKDLLDVERMLAARGSAFDRAYVRRWLVELVGEDDDRLPRWDAMCADIPSTD